MAVAGRSGPRSPEWIRTPRPPRARGPRRGGGEEAARVRPRRPHRRLHLEPPRPPPESLGSCHGRPGQRPGRRLLPWLAGAIAPAARALLGSMAGRGSCIGLGASRASSLRQPSVASPCPVDVPPVNRRRFGPRSPESKQQRPQIMLRASKLSSTTSKSSSAAPGSSSAASKSSSAASKSSSIAAGSSFAVSALLCSFRRRGGSSSSAPFSGSCSAPSPRAPPSWRGRRDLRDGALLESVNGKERIEKPAAVEKRDAGGQAGSTCHKRKEGIEDAE
ncbi:hypothetical protein GQ55_6G081500 [Panicum hallii var. hallii]|uniref:Uncharacterized protein n=1 Tax=Panicum hallii var. hallii TaxID=1504633 RepID=A0A2T7D563_9POAL|nr:hypothetical protein GQ55_6G081500 [Panicum hallii var. hallii]